MFLKKKSIFSIRKLAVGTASVLLALSLVPVGSFADDTDTTTTEAETTATTSETTEATDTTDSSTTESSTTDTSTSDSTTTENSSTTTATSNTEYSYAVYLGATLRVDGKVYNFGIDDVDSSDWLTGLSVGDSYDLTDKLASAGLGIGSIRNFGDKEFVLTGYSSAQGTYQGNGVRVMLNYYPKGSPEADAALAAAGQNATVNPADTTNQTGTDMKVLPHTGDAASLALPIAGALTALTGWAVYKKKED